MISILIATYKRQKLLERLLKSIQNQSLKDGYEVLILDDCSPDNTQEFAENLCANDPRFRYFRMEKNLGFGDKVFNKAIEEHWYKGDWIILFSDDEFIYTNDYLEKINNLIKKDKDLDFIGTEQAYGYGDFVARVPQSDVKLPEIFRYNELNDKQKELANKSLYIAYKESFYLAHPLDYDKNENSDACCEVPYVSLFKDAKKMGFVENAPYIFGIEPRARTKYLDFYTRILSIGLMGYGDGKNDPNDAFLLMNSHLNGAGSSLDAFFDWGGNELALVLKHFLSSPNFPTILRAFAKIYENEYGEKLRTEYTRFNAALANEKERETMLKNADCVVLYGDNSYRAQIEAQLKERGAKIAYVADDGKKGAPDISSDGAKRGVIKNANDIEQDFKTGVLSKNSVVFIVSGSPKITNLMLNNLEKARKNGLKVCSLIMRDDEWDGVARLL